MSSNVFSPIQTLGFGLKQIWPKKDPLSYLIRTFEPAGWLQRTNAPMSLWQGSWWPQIDYPHIRTVYFGPTGCLHLSAFISRPQSSPTHFSIPIWGVLDGDSLVVLRSYIGRSFFLLIRFQFQSIDLIGKYPDWNWSIFASAAQIAETPGTAERQHAASPRINPLWYMSIRSESSTRQHRSSWWCVESVIVWI
jgi:hypothetical protein